MSTWDERVKSHAIWNQLENLGPVLDQCLQLDDLEPAAVEALERLKAVLSFAGKRLSASDSNLINPANLDSLVAHLQIVSNESQAFLTNQNLNSLNNANLQADILLSVVSLVPIAAYPDDLSGMRQSADDYRQVLEKNLRTTSDAMTRAGTEIQSLDSRLQAFAAEITAEKQRTTALASDQQSQFSTAQETRSKEFTDTQARRQEKFDSLVDQYKTQLTGLDAEFSVHGTVLLKEHQGQLAALTGDYQGKAKGIVDTIEGHLKAVEKLVGVIGNLGVTSGYLRDAQEAKWTARFWQAVTVISLGGIIGVAWKAFVPLVQGGFSWESFAGRVFVSLTVGLLAAYAISQADKYQVVERRSRRLALELEAIGPFLASLPIEKQEIFRLKVGDKTFGTSEELADKPMAPSPKSVVDVIKPKEMSGAIVEILGALKSFKDK